MNTTTRAGLERARRIAGAVLDPELPMVTIGQLGILRDVHYAGDAALVVTITPTYSGCPATAVIEGDVRDALARAGFASVRVQVQLVPAWSSDDITPAGRRALAEAGVSPPNPARAGVVPLGVRCPQCGSLATVELSRFGSTACTALWRCQTCREPFSHVKSI